MTPSGRVRVAALTLANVLLPIAILTFASGFFPYKPMLTGLASFEHEEYGDAQHAIKQPEAIFDRIVFMVVDALRSDFVYGYDSGFEFTQSLIRSGAAIPFTAHATPPTVTMPRVKALTTGSVPSFLDLILNFAESDTSSSLAAQDTWLAQIRKRGGKIIFYGDDTWLKLFPGDSHGGGEFFARTDGTSSFFVSDFTEVDNNVTRHVPDELGRSDWDAMIMHYLGLDHIGHKTGPQGPNMLPKQHEMDGIVRMIYESMESERHHEKTLLVLAGDHGMNAGGNHGGSGPGETEPALLFASPQFKKQRRISEQYEAPTTPKSGTEFHYYTKVQQSDLIPTLSGLMGFPVSRNSLGVYISELGGFWDDAETTQLLRQNAAQILQIIEALHGKDAFHGLVSDFVEKRDRGAQAQTLCDVDGFPRLACLLAYAQQDTHNVTATHESLYGFLLAAQDTLSGTASSYDIPRMVYGILLTLIIVLLTILSFPSLTSPSPAGLFFTAICILYGIMMFASSYVEEEQHLWYWLVPAWIVLLTTTRSGFLQASSERQTRIGVAAFALLAVHRFAVRWNQTGQKYAGAPDIVHAFFTRQHHLMWLLILATYAYVGVQLVLRSFAGIVGTEIAAITALVLVLPAVVFKLNFTQADAPELVQGLADHIRSWTQPFSLVLQARIAFAAIGITTIAVIALSLLSARVNAKAGQQRGERLPRLAQRLHYLLTLFLITQTRAPNVPLFLGMEIQFQAIQYLLTPASPASTSTIRLPATRPATVVYVATSALLASHVYFFAAAGSNSISSIDLSNAYNGVADYNIAAVGVLLFAGNWAGPVWWCSAAVLLLSPPRSSPPSQKRDARSWVSDERAKLRQDALQSVKSSGSTSPASGNMAAWTTYLSYMTAFVAVSLLAVMAACTALRTHLFIWTVFSPKYLYAMAWSIGWHLIINIGLGSALMQAAKID